MSASPRITPFLSEVRGTFYREVDRDRASSALAGSHLPGRYSRADQPTLYLSATRAGVAAAMQAHPHGGPTRMLLTFELSAVKLFDLRKPKALELVRREAGDPLADWQQALRRGEVPSSWGARDWIESTGAAGLIDPSRRAPGLWHVVLLRWNVPGGPTVVASGDAS